MSYYSLEPVTWFESLHLVLGKKMTLNYTKFGKIRMKNNKTSNF